MRATGADPAQPAGHGRIRLIEPSCTSCMLCVRECPVWCISLDSHTEPDPDVAPGARVRMVNVLDRFVIDWGVCMYCGICVEECPFDALAWDTDHPAAAATPTDLRHGIPELAQPLSAQPGASRVATPR